MDQVMTDYQYKSILQTIKIILDGCENIEEAKEKIDMIMLNTPDTKEKEGDK